MVEKKKSKKKKRDTKEMSWFTKVFYSLFDPILFQSVCNQIVGCFLQVFKVVFFSTKFIQLRNQIDFVLKPVDWLGWFHLLVCSMVLVGDISKNDFHFNQYLNNNNNLNRKINKYFNISSVLINKKKKRIQREKKWIEVRWRWDDWKGRSN